MSDFASSALYNLAVSRLEVLGLEADSLKEFGGKTESSRKKRLLERALENLGPGAVLSIGQGIRAMPFEPLLSVFRRSVDVADFIDRWMRLERYYHGKHRVRVVSLGDTDLTLEHYSTSGEAPSAGEDLLIAGLLAAILEEIGCMDLSLTIDGIEGNAVSGGRVREHLKLTLPVCPVWRYAWSGFEKTTRTAKRKPQGGTVADWIGALIGDDPGRGWRLDMVARELGQSKRSLQRSLSAEGETFQKLLRRIRTAAASSALLEQGGSLAEIGYACGFSDQAHFTREFHSRFNMTPNSYLALAGKA